MALVFALYDSDDAYSEFWVNDTKVRLEKIEGPQRYVLRVCSPYMDELHTITDRQATEILPQVFVSAGDKLDPGRPMVKAVISAPRNIRLDRGVVRENAGN